MKKLSLLFLTIWLVLPGATAYCFPPVMPTSGGAVGTDAIWDAKGDLAVGSAANTATKLTIGTAYQVLHVATDTPGWTSTLGATGTRLTAGWFTDLTVTNAIAGSITGNSATVTIADAAADTTTFPLLGTADTGSLAPATDAGLTYNANTNVLTAGGLMSGANITAGTAAAAGTIYVYDGSDHYASIATPALSGNIALVLPSASATLMANPMTAEYDIIVGGASGAPTRMAGTTPNSILSVNNSGVLGFNTAISIDDSAAQFYGATAGHIGLLKIDLAGSTTDKTMTIASSQTDNRTLTLPDTTGTLITSSSTLDFVTTGTISGRIPVVSDADGLNIATTQIGGHFHLATGTGTWLLPAMAAADGTGHSFCLYSTTNDDVHLDVDASDKIRYNGALKTAGKKLTISDVGSFICAVLSDYDSDIAHWTILGTKGTITAEAD